MCHRRRSRRGISKATVLISLLACVGVFAIVSIVSVMYSMRVNEQRSKCASRLGEIGTALLTYDLRVGKYPGYMNCLITDKNEAYRDPQTGRPTPVSWVVELLGDLDDPELRRKWKSGQPTTEQIRAINCPANPAAGSPQHTSYVVNSGMRDLPKSIVAQPPMPGMPRDWPANGIFLDYFSDDKLVNPDDATRGPLVTMRSGQVRDPKDKTIMVTENLDATTYLFRPTDFPNGDPSLTEITWGCNWAVGAMQRAAPTALPTMSVPDTVFAPNQGMTTQPHAPDYKYCRPASGHPGGFYALFAGKNVMFMNDKLSYYIYAKLMASDDKQAKLPGSEALVDEAFRNYYLNNSDLEQ